MNYTFTPLAIEDVIVVDPPVFGDQRGFLSVTYHAGSYAAGGIDTNFVQDNLSFSRYGILRGLHYQLPPFTQGKLLQVISGVIWDVAVDIRRSSATYGQWVAAELSAENHRQLWVPPGFAHGFVVLSAEAHVLYKCSALYAPPTERGIRWNDPDIAIEWPIKDVTVSDRDANLPYLAAIEPLTV